MYSTRSNYNFFIEYLIFQNIDQCLYGGLVAKDTHSKNKLSQEELAKAMGTTSQTMTSIEVGKHRASLLLGYKVSNYFGLII